MKPRDTVQVDDTDQPHLETRPPGAHLYEPDGAVNRTGLIGQAAATVHGRQVDSSIAYLTSHAQVNTPLARGYAVLKSFPFQPTVLRSWLREHRIGRLTIKKRGTAVEPENQRRQPRISSAWGENETTIVLTPLAGQQSVIIVRPLASP